MMIGTPQCAYSNRIPRKFRVALFRGILPWNYSAEGCRGIVLRNSATEFLPSVIYSAEMIEGIQRDDVTNAVTEGTDHVAELNFQKMTAAVPAEPFRGIPRQYFRGREFRPTVV